MGFTPASGLVMSTRTGDLDPGLAYYLSRTAHMTPARFHQMVNHESGLLVSATSADSSGSGSVTGSAFSASISTDDATRQTPR
jgi:acetate kinase